MTRLIIALCAAFALAVPAFGDDRYETLLIELAESESPADAERLSGEIWEIWLTAPDAAAQAVLDAAMGRRMQQDFFGAILELNRLIESYPSYAEGWNQRATMYYILGDFERSLADVDEVLALEPRHFGALSGRAVIYARQGKTGLAQIAVREALKYHPHLNERAILNIEAGEDI